MRVPGGDPRSLKILLGGRSLSASCAERVSLLPARSDLVGGLPFASLFVFMNLTRTPTAASLMERRMSVNSNLGLCGRRRCCLRARRLSPAEGVEIGPDVLHGLLVEGLDRGLPALRGIDFQLHLAAFGIYGVRRIHVDTFVGGIFHLYRPVSDRYRHGNPAGMDGQHFLASTNQLPRLEIGLELEFCSRIGVERAAERRSEPFLSLRH